jgi:hypothetical protein
VIRILKNRKSAVKQTLRSVLPLFAVAVAFSQNPTILFDFETGFDISSVVGTDDVQVSLIDGSSGQALEAVFGVSSEQPGIRLSSSGWDLSDHVGITMDVYNAGATGVGVIARLNGSGWNDGFAWVEPGERETLEVIMKRGDASGYVTNYLWGMNGLPGGHVRLWDIADPENINRIDINLVAPEEEKTVYIDNIRAYGEYRLPAENELQNSFFPFVDVFGQYMHGDWPGKTLSQGDIASQHQDELAALGENPGPESWNQYGGWTGGPQLEATGHVRVEKYQDKWWLVDPDGRLFWSQGIDCVGPWQQTPTDGREHYFTEIPDNGDFLVSNLKRKYGSDWSQWNDASIDIIHRRLRSWGINTIGNWSSGTVYEARRTPYVATLSSGVSKDVPADLNETDFRNMVRDRINAGALAGTAGDPWCIGYFVDNELRWPGSNTETVAETYYRIVSEEVKASAPDKLYLGSRLDFHFYGGESNAMVTNAARYCDVISFNRYRFSVADLKLPPDIDKPAIIGEFHFGALDRGLPHTGLRSVGSQKQRARAYTYYIRQALKHPHIVGAHWFQYGDQVVTGRFDGENYQIGFVDIVDRPYPEMVDASRSLGEYLYDYRLTGTVDVNDKEALLKPYRPAGAGRIEVFDLKGRCVLVLEKTSYRTRGQGGQLVTLPVHASGLYIRKTVSSKGSWSEKIAVFR